MYLDLCPGCPVKYRPLRLEHAEVHSPFDMLFDEPVRIFAVFLLPFFTLSECSLCYTLFLVYMQKVVNNDDFPRLFVFDSSCYLTVTLICFDTPLCAKAMTVQVPLPLAVILPPFETVATFLS